MEDTTNTVISDLTEKYAAPSDSEIECVSLCGSELEAEMAWGDGPIAPLQPNVDDSSRSKSNPNGSGRAKTPQKRNNPSPLQKSKRLINIHPMRSPAYMTKPNELPVGGRKQQRWFNDHHFGNKAASTNIDDLMEHMSITVEWRSNFQKLAEPENKDLQTAFRKGRVRINEMSNQPKRRHDEWSRAEAMFAQIDRRARTPLLRSFSAFSDYIEAVEYIVVYFLKWQEIPSDIDIPGALQRVLLSPLQIASFKKDDTRLCIPLIDSAFHRLIIHCVCQFYGIRSRTEMNTKYNTKIMILKISTRTIVHNDCDNISLCDYVRVTRQSTSISFNRMIHETDPLEEQTKKISECSDGYCMMDFPSI